MSDGFDRGETCDWCSKPKVSAVETEEEDGLHRFDVCSRHLEAARDWDSFNREVSEIAQ